MKTIRAEGGVYHGAVHDERLQPAATFVPPPHPWGALVTACIALFLIAVNTTAINTAVSAIADDLTLSSTTLAWAMNAYLLDLTDVSTTYSGLWLPTLVAGIGVGMTFSTPSAAGLQAVPPEECGEASGIINIFRYVGASLVVAVGSPFYTGVGIAEMNRHLDAAGVNHVEEEQLDQALTGSPDAITAQANQLQGAQRQAFISGAQQGTVDGFDASMLVIAVTSVGGLVLWLVLMRPGRRGGGRPS